MGKASLQHFPAAVPQPADGWSHDSTSHQMHIGSSLHLSVMQLWEFQWSWLLQHRQFVSSFIHSCSVKEPIPAVSRQRQDYRPWTSGRFVAGIHRHTSNYTLILPHSYCQSRVPTVFGEGVSEVCEEPENSQTPHRQAEAKGIKLTTFWLWGNMLISVAPCRPGRRVCKEAAAAETKFGGEFVSGTDKELDVIWLQFALNMFPTTFRW